MRNLSPESLINQVAIDAGQLYSNYFPDDSIRYNTKKLRRSLSSPCLSSSYTATRNLRIKRSFSTPPLLNDNIGNMVNSIRQEIESTQQENHIINIPDYVVSAEESRWYEAFKKNCKRAWELNKHWWPKYAGTDAPMWQAGAILAKNYGYSSTSLEFYGLTGTGSFFSETAWVLLQYCLDSDVRGRTISELAGCIRHPLANQIIETLCLGVAGFLGGSAWQFIVDNIMTYSRSTSIVIPTTWLCQGVLFFILITLFRLIAVSTGQYVCQYNRNDIYSFKQEYARKKILKQLNDDFMIGIFQVGISDGFFALTSAPPDFLKFLLAENKNTVGSQARDIMRAWGTNTTGYTIGTFMLEPSIRTIAEKAKVFLGIPATLYRWFDHRIFTSTRTPRYNVLPSTQGP